MHSLKLGRFAGITLELHWTTILFILFLIIISPIYAIVLTLLFAIISIHEFSHALVAKREGIKVSRVILLPIGGMAVMEESSMSPEKEFYMALAGPMSNFVMALIWVVVVAITKIPMYTLGTWNSMVSGDIPINWVGLTSSSFFWLNWLLGTFNLFVPAIPMDGGRVLRAILAMKMNYISATKVSVYVSKFLTGLMFIISILTLNVILFLIAIFLWIAASAEFEQAVNMTVLPKINLNSLLRHGVSRTPPRTRVRTALAKMIKTNTPQLFVGKNKCVTIEDLKKSNPDDPVSDYAREIKPIEVAMPEVMMKSFLAQNVYILPVKKSNRIIGYIDVRDLERAIELAKLVYSR